MGTVSWDIIQIILAQVVALLLYQLPAVEDGQKRQQQSSVFIISHPAAIVALA